MRTAAEPEVIPFRKQPKSIQGFQTPDGVMSIIRREAEKRGWTQAMAHSFLICRGGNVDPAIFGIPTARDAS